jgi:RND family efflux transporter MFP subunit
MIQQTWNLEMFKKIKNSSPLLNRDEPELKLTLIVKTVFLLLFSCNVLAQFGGPSAVKVSSVQKLMMSPVRKIPASVQAKFISTIKAESRGVVSSMADIGGLINQGDVLAELTDTQSKLREQELQDAVNSARAKHTFLKAENTRLKDLLSKNLISQSQLDRNHSDYISSQSDLAQNKSRFDQFIDQMTKLRIIAPFDGHVMQQFAQPGQFLNSGDNVLEFMQASNLEVVVNVPFKYKAQIINGAIWQIKSNDNRMIDATINRFIPAATGNSRTIEVHLTITDENLWSGESVNVLVPTEAKKQVVAVPRDALVIRKNGSFVYTVVENKSHKVDVITGVAQGEMIAVKGLLSPGDVVIVRGNERLRPQQDVKIIEN